MTTQRDESKKNAFLAWSSDDPKKDPTFAKMVETVDEDNGVNFWLKANVGSLERDDVRYLKEQEDKMHDAEYRKLANEKAAFMAQRLDAEKAEDAERQRSAARAEKRAQEAAAERARKGRTGVMVQVKPRKSDGERPTLQSPGVHGSSEQEAASGKGATGHNGSSTVVKAAEGGSLAGLLGAYGDSSDESDSDGNEEPNGKAAPKETCS